MYNYVNHNLMNLRVRIFHIETIGSRIRYLRKQKKMIQSDFASKIGRTLNTVMRWENGQIEPPKSALATIAQTFGVPLLWLEEGIGELVINEAKEPDTREWTGVSFASAIPFLGSLEGYPEHPDTVDFLKIPGLVHTNVHAITVDNRQVYPIEKGDIVLIKKSEKEPQPDSLAVFRDKLNMPIIRKIRLIKGKLWLCTDRAGEEPEEYNGIPPVAVVVEVISRLNL
jgi:transcriptional regulator with XRE-family HTH domain